MKKPIFVKLRSFARTCVDLWKIIITFLWDMYNFMRFSSRTHWPRDNRAMFDARISAMSHSIEKALSFRDCRPGFGQPALRILIGLLKEYKQRFCCDGEARQIFTVAVSSIHKYIVHAKDAGVDINWLEVSMDELGHDPDGGGTITYSLQDWNSELETPFDRFCASRHSIRDFSDQPVSREKIESALNLAKTAPSSCNRQTARCYIVSDADMIKDLLALQGGARGFDHQVRCLIVIGSDYFAWRGELERNQGFIDGGIYAMNLLYGLHYAGLGACPLIWGRGRKRTATVREKIGMPANENIVLLIATGELPDQFKVARSTRIPIDEISTFV